jgi:hypothetical protein
VIFNRHDAVTDVELTYRKVGGISRAQCLDIHVRTQNWLLKAYGPFGLEADNKRIVLRGSLSPPTIQMLSMQPDSATFVSGFSRTITGTPLWGKPITKWDNARYIDLFTFFLDLEGGSCNLTIGFHEPIAVERMITEAPKSSPAPTSSAARSNSAKPESEEEPDGIVDDINNGQAQ